MVVPLALAFALQAGLRPPCAIVGFRDLKEPKSAFGRIAEDLFAIEWAEGNARPIDSSDRVHEAARLVDVDPLAAPLDTVARVVERLGARRYLRGEIVDYRTRTVQGRPCTEVALRVVLYSVAWEFPLNFAFERGASDPKNGLGTERSRLLEALASAVAVVAQKLDASGPRARVKRATPLDVIIDGGARAGFRVGARVLVTRGVIERTRGHVIRCGLDEAEIKLEGNLLTLSEGDTVRQAMEPIPLPPAGESVFDVERDPGLGGSHPGLGVR